MLRTLLKSKLHRVRVTEADLNYNGSITIDSDLLDAANLIEHEKVDVLDINNGNRLSTYVIRGEAGSGEICINGAAARLVSPGDLVIIVSYGEFSEEEIEGYEPAVIFVDDHNRVIEHAEAT